MLKKRILVFLLVHMFSQSHAQFIYPNNFHRSDVQHKKIDRSIREVSSQIPVSFWSRAKNIFFAEQHKTRSAYFINGLLQNSERNQHIRLYRYDQGDAFQYRCNYWHHSGGFTHWHDFLNSSVDYGGRNISVLDFTPGELAQAAQRWELDCPESLPLDPNAMGGVDLVLWDYVRDDGSIFEAKSVFRSYANAGTFIYSSLFKQTDFDTINIPNNLKTMDEHEMPILTYRDLAVPVYPSPGIGGGASATASGYQLVVKAGTQISKVELTRNVVLASRLARKTWERLRSVAKTFQLLERGIESLELVPGFKVGLRLRRHLMQVEQLIDGTNIQKFLRKGISGAHTEESFEQAIAAVLRVPGVKLISKFEQPLENFLKGGQSFASQVTYELEYLGKRYRHVKSIYKVSEDMNAAGRITSQQLVDISLLVANKVQEMIKLGARIDQPIIVSLNGKKFMALVSSEEKIVETIFAIP